MTLHIAPKVTLPSTYVTEVTAVIGQRRSGKTYTGSVIAEELAREKTPMVILDPTSAWWGLRSSADGQRKGLPVVILGGAHGDLPLEDRAGAVVADMVVDHPGLYVLDLGAWETRASEIRFARDFLERLYRRKAQDNSPLHVFLDEAELFAPQRVGPEETKMLAATEALAKRGGIRGLGVTMITQRPAALNKHLLEQADRLILLRIGGPNDRRAVDGYVSSFAEGDERSEIMGSLSSLGQGDAWIYAPRDGVVERVKIRERRTFNSSATPKHGETRLEPKVLAAVDLDALRERMAATVAKAEAEDPKLLQKEIARLMAKIREMEADDGPVYIEKDVPVFTEKEFETLKTTAERVHVVVTEANEKLLAAVMPVLQAFEAHVAKMGGALAVLDMAAGSAISRDLAKYAMKNRERREALAAPVEVTPDPAPTPGEQYRRDTINAIDGELTGPQRKVLTVLAQFPNGCSKQKLAMLAGYSPKGGSFNNTLSSLRTAELILRGDPILISTAGVQAVGEYEKLPSGAALFEFWLGKVDGPMRKILEALAEAGRPLSKAELGEATGYEPKGGSFNNALSRLRTLELIERGSEIRLNETLEAAVGELVAR